MTGNEQIRGWPDYSSSMYDDDPFERDKALNEIWAQVIPEEMWANPTTPEKLEVEMVSHALPEQDHVKQSTTPEKLEVEMVSHALPEQDHVKQSTTLKNVTNERKWGRVHSCRPKIYVGRKGAKAGDWGIVTKQLRLFTWIKLLEDCFAFHHTRRVSPLPISMIVFVFTSPLKPLGVVLKFHLLWVVCAIHLSLGLNCLTVVLILLGLPYFSFFYCHRHIRVSHETCVL